ncbi:MAG: hypothetical protein KGZ62_10475 [Sulfurimonas sp.]|nr:hypothetical protein [Sulfurimonas sp.]
MSVSSYAHHGGGLTFWLGGDGRTLTIESLIECGEITVGVIRPLGCVAAIASDRHDALAILKRRDGETLQQLLMRLDQAVAKAGDGGEFTDEVNG